MYADVWYMEINGNVMGSVKKKNRNFLKSSAGLLHGMMITLKHFFNPKRKINKGISDKNYFKQREGSVTVQYPSERIPIPEVGRYQLDVHIDDCIVCDLCAKICPVDCIDIISIKATEDIGKTSDGTTKRLYAAKFDIDMAKCMFCGLCTIVCPTECIIMTDGYDKSVADVKELNYIFADMTEEEIEEKRKLLAKAEEEKRAAKEAALKASQEKKADN
jgi:NADH-quinone oxidoreductase subunit I